MLEDPDDHWGYQPLHVNRALDDLRRVRSKYIGETEKNLERLLGAFEVGGVVLVVDEADALFGRRTEVKDSHDRDADEACDD